MSDVEIEEVDEDESEEETSDNSESDSGSDDSNDKTNSEEDDSEEDEANDDPNTLKISTPIINQLNQLQRLHVLNKQISSRLLFAKEAKESRIKKEEDKIASFLEEKKEDDDKMSCRELEIFKKMEKLAESSFCSKSSLVEKFINNKFNPDDTQSQISEIHEDVDSSILSSPLNQSFESIAKTPSPKFSKTKTNTSKNIEMVSFESKTMKPSPKNDTQMFNSSKIPENVSVLTESILNESHERKRFAVQETLKVELDSMRKLREKVENTELQLQNSKREFEKYKREEQAKLDKEKKRLQAESKNFETIKTEAEKIRQLNISLQEEVKKMHEKIETMNLEFSRKANRWDMTRKKLEGKITQLEIEIEDLEDGKTCKNPNLSSSFEEQSNRITSVLKEPSPICNSSENSSTNKNLARKIHFQENKISDSKKSTCTANFKKSENPRSGQNFLRKGEGVRCTGPAAGYFSKPVDVTKKPLRSSLKQTSSSVNVRKSQDETESQKFQKQKEQMLEYVENHSGSSPITFSTERNSLNSAWTLSEGNEENLDPDIGPQLVNRQKSQNQKESSGKSNSFNQENKKGNTFVNSDGDVETVFANGTRKLYSKSRNFKRTIYQNGDIKEKRPDGSIQYFFVELGLRHYIYPNGLEMTSYSNGQIQRKNPDGTSEILFANGCVKFTRPDGKEDYIFPDNTVYQVDTTGNTILFLPNGQKEVHSEKFSKRIFPDGTEKTIFSDGSVETRYPNGRIRIKDVDGNLVSDTVDESKCIPSPSENDRTNLSFKETPNNNSLNKSNENQQQWS